MNEGSSQISGRDGTTHPAAPRVIELGFPEIIRNQKCLLNQQTWVWFPNGTFFFSLSWFRNES
jgi:hypothetical protein